MADSKTLCKTYLYIVFPGFCNSVYNDSIKFWNISPFPNNKYLFNASMLSKNLNFLKKILTKSLFNKS